MLTEILKKLLSLSHNDDKKLLGGLRLCWRPPNVLIITRPDVPPSPDELTVVEKHLKAMGWSSVAGKLRSKTGKGGQGVVLLEIDVEPGAAAGVG